MHRTKRKKRAPNARPAKTGGRPAAPSCAKTSPFGAAWQSPSIVLAAAVVLAYLIWPVFGSFFIGEDLASRGALLVHGPAHQFWSALYQTGGAFWRPAVAIWFAVSDSLLPPDPTAYHIRNLAATLTCLVVLYLLIAHLTDWVWARALGMGWFAASKVHFTTVGCAEMIDSVATLLHSLLTLYFYALFLHSSRKLHFWCALLFFALALGSRDYGIVLLPVMAILALATMTTSGEWSWRRLFSRMLPFCGVSAVYFGARLLAFRGFPIPPSGNYAPRLDVDRFLTHLKCSAADLFNVSLDEPWVHGSGSFATLLGLTPARAWDIGFLTLAVAVLVVTFAPALRGNARFWVGLGFAAAFLAPTFLVGLAQTYYMLVPVAGMAIALAAAVETWRPPLRRIVAWAWAAVLLLYFLNGLAMRRTVTSLWWYNAGNRAREAYRSMIVKQKGQPVNSLTLLVGDKGTAPHWQWVLDPFGGPGLVQVLSGNPNLRFRVAEAGTPEARTRIGPESAAYLVRNGLFQPLSPIIIRAAAPLTTRAGHGFNVQPDGSSELRLQAENATPGSYCLLDGRALPSEVTSSSEISCRFLPDSYSRPGRYHLHVEDRATGVQSNSLEFRIMP